MVVVEIKVELKPGVADPEGQNTKKALEQLGFADIKSVRSIKLFQMELDMSAAEAKKAGEEMCRKLLANPVIQKFSVSVK